MLEICGIKSRQLIQFCIEIDDCRQARGIRKPLVKKKIEFNLQNLDVVCSDSSVKKDIYSLLIVSNKHYGYGWIQHEQLQFYKNLNAAKIEDEDQNF